MARVYVYRNLRTRTWSVKHRGKVIAHPEEVLVRNAKFQVSEAGRKRVLAEGRKNVHAFVTAASLDDVSFDGTAGLGKVRRTAQEKPFNWEEVIYNPYKYENFVQMRGGAPAPPSRWVYMTRFSEVWRSSDQLRNGG